MTDVIQHTDLNEDIRYAQALVARPQGGAQSLLPQAYRDNPANVLIAIGLGKAIGITPAQALYEIYVVNGRPSPSANLLGALVRRAGHKLRIEGDTQRATATLIRHDDPDHPFSATWTIEQAKAAGLTGKDTWKSYPAAMLRARAISEVVRMGASEAVMGMEYSAEEMRDITATTEVAAPTLDTIRAAVKPEPAPEPYVHPQDPQPPAEDVHEGEVEPEPPQGDPISDAQLKTLQILARGALGSDRDARLAWLTKHVGRPVKSANDLTKSEASSVIDALDAIVGESA